MANQKMGFEGKLYLGTTGSTAATLLENVTDVTITLDVEKGNTTVRGDGSVPPINTEAVTIRSWSCQWTMINDINDASLTTLKSAAALATSVAIRTKDHITGTGFDGDCYITMENGQPLRGEQTFQFTAVPNRNTRTPTLNS
jgi:hypothetical protein